MKKNTKTEKVYKIKICPKCGSDAVHVVVEQEKRGEWTCKSCKYHGKNIDEKKLDSEAFLEYLESKEGKEDA